MSHRRGAQPYVGRSVNAQCSPAWERSVAIGEIGREFDPSIPKNAGEQSGGGHDCGGRGSHLDFRLGDNRIRVQTETGEQQIVILTGGRGATVGAIQHVSVDRRLQPQCAVGEGQRAGVDTTVDAGGELVEHLRDVRVVPTVFGVPLRQHQDGGFDQSGINVLGERQLGLNVQRLVRRDHPVLVQQYRPVACELFDSACRGLASQHNDLFSGFGALEVLCVESGVGERLTVRRGECRNQRVERWSRRHRNFGYRQSASPNEGEEGFRLRVQRVEGRTEVAKHLRPHAGGVGGQGDDLGIETFVLV
ncbi:MAG: hypothetical protein OXG42_03670 [Chloroflexi bacterium]|nr:hypothetical protein [Chloroflexota bacterium]